MKLFGFEFKKEKAAAPQSGQLASFAPPEVIDGSVVVANSGVMAGHYSSVIDVNTGVFGSEKDLILKYREAAEEFECDNAIAEIVNGSISGGTQEYPVKLVIDEPSLSASIKTKISQEFDVIVGLLDLKNNAHDLFKKWYIDGKLYYNIIVDPAKQKAGIKELRLIDPLNIKKIREISTDIDSQTGVKTSFVSDEYFLYYEQYTQAVNRVTGTQGSVGALRINKDTVIYVPSGIVDKHNKHAISYLQKSLKPINQLKMLENSVVVYRIARGPERRVFYVDTGTLPKGKAEEYVQGIMSKFRKKLTYDSKTGEISSDAATMAITEDFWLPRREGGKGTEITTLAGGEGLGKIDDLEYFQKRLYRSLNVPTGRLAEDNGFSVGRSSEISREEVKFQKFIDRLRAKFSVLFLDALKTQLVLKGIMSQEEWGNIKQHLYVDFIKDSHFAELKDFEVLGERIKMADMLRDYVGVYFSREYVATKIFNMTDEEIKEQQTQIKKEGLKNAELEDGGGASVAQEEPEPEPEEE